MASELETEVLELLRAKPMRSAELLSVSKIAEDAKQLSNCLHRMGKLKNLIVQRDGLWQLKGGAIAARVDIAAMPAPRSSTSKKKKTKAADLVAHLSTPAEIDSIEQTLLHEIAARERQTTALRAALDVYRGKRNGG